MASGREDSWWDFERWDKLSPYQHTSLRFEEVLANYYWIRQTLGVLVIALKQEGSNNSLSAYSAFLAIFKCTFFCYRLSAILDIPSS